MSINSSTPLNYLYRYAKHSYKNCYSQEEFIVQHLFKKVEWNRIDINTRKNLGKKFLKYAKSLGNNKIKKNGKTDLRQQIYKKL